MNATEAATLCRAVKSVCPQQKFDEYTPDFWHPLLEDIAFEDAKRGLIEVAKRQPFVSPAEIRTEVFANKRRLVAAIPAVVPPWQLADMPAEEQRWISNYRHAIADGLTSEVATTKANYLSNITDDPEPLAIEASVVEKGLEQFKQSFTKSKPAPAKRAPVQRYPAQWAGDKGITVLDPDGWRNARKDFRSLCTEAEFDAMAAESTVGPFQRMTTPIPTADDGEEVA